MTCSQKTAIVVLNRNQRQMTAECLRSVLAMQAAEFEVVVVDNGSSDGSVEMLGKEFPQITLLPQRENLGFAAGCNIGMRYALASGAEFVLLLNNDTTVAPDLLSELLDAIRGDLRIAAACPKIYFADAPRMLWYAGADFNLWIGTSKHRGWRQIDNGQFDRDRCVRQATGCAMLIRQSAIREVGLLDEQFWAYVEDLDWSIRFHQSGYRLAFAPKACVWHRWGATAVQALGSGSHVVPQFLSTRNAVLLARKHLKWWQIPTYVFGFLATHIAFYSALRLSRRDFKALKAIYVGVFEGLRMPLDDRHNSYGKTDVRNDLRHLTATSVDEPR
jgi:GT2 family glycosyltransferase